MAIGVSSEALSRLTGIPLSTFHNPDEVRRQARVQLDALTPIITSGFRSTEATQHGPPGTVLPINQQEFILAQRAGLAAILGERQIPVPLDGGLQRTGVPDLLIQVPGVQFGQSAPAASSSVRGAIPIIAAAIAAAFFFGRR